MSEIALTKRPPAGRIRRGLYGREYASGRVAWFVSRSDVIAAHKEQIARARSYRLADWPDRAAMHLIGVATLRRILTQRKRINTLDILRGRA